jgi:hypothetical protein
VVVAQQHDLAIVLGLDLAHALVEDALELVADVGLRRRRTRVRDGRREDPAGRGIPARQAPLVRGVALLRAVVGDPVADLVLGDLRQPLQHARLPADLELAELLHRHDAGILDDVVGVAARAQPGAHLDAHDAPQPRLVAAEELVHRAAIAALDAPDELDRLGLIRQVFGARRQAGDARGWLERTRSHDPSVSSRPALGDPRGAGSAP